MTKTPIKTAGQKEAEADVETFREDLGPFVVAAETTRMAMVFTDATEPDNPIVFANDSFLSLTGFGREEVPGQSFNFFMANGADAEALATLKSQFEGGEEGGAEVRYRRKDRTEFWAAVFISPVRDHADNVVQYFASFVDLTRHKDEEAQSKMLIAELNHRAKNTLATVQSIIWQAFRSELDPGVVRASIESRLAALSRSHDLLARENWKSAGLSDVIGAALELFVGADGRASRVHLKGENVQFPPQSALALGIVFNELATNAVKYGAFSNGVGSISIEWTIVAKPEGRRILLQWREADGPPVTPPLHKGFGSRVLDRGLAGELQGKVGLDYQATGLVVTMDFPAPIAGQHG